MVLPPLDPDRHFAWLHGGRGRSDPPTVLECWRGMYHYAQAHGLACPTLPEYRREVVSLAARQRKLYRLRARFPGMVTSAEPADRRLAERASAAEAYAEKLRGLPDSYWPQLTKDWIRL